MAKHQYYRKGRSGYVKVDAWRGNFAQVDGKLVHKSEFFKTHKPCTEEEYVKAKAAAESKAEVGKKVGVGSSANVPAKPDKDAGEGVRTDDGNPGPASKSGE